MIKDGFPISHLLPSSIRLQNADELKKGRMVTDGIEPINPKETKHLVFYGNVQLVKSTLRN